MTVLEADSSAAPSAMKTTATAKNSGSTVCGVSTGFQAFSRCCLNFESKEKKKEEGERKEKMNESAA